MDTDNDSTLPPRSERRQRQKKPKLQIGHFIIALAVVALIGGIGVYSYHVYYTSTTDYRVEQAFRFVDRADEKLTKIDAIINSEVSEDTAKEVDAALKSIEPTRDLLRQAADFIKRAQANAGADEKEYLTNIQESIALRGQMLGLAPELLNVTQQSAKALKGATKGWNKLTAATKAATAATKAFDKEDKAGMLESVKKNNDALTALAEARVEFNDATRVLEGLAFDAYLSYIDLREQMAQSAISAANSWASNDKTALKVDLERYEKLRTQAAAMEDNELVTPEAIIANAYQQLVGAQNAEYLDIREQVLTLDKKVR